MSGFNQALPIVLGFEGGVSDHPLDAGGLTAHGITQASYDRYRGSLKQPKRPVTEATKDEVHHLYFRDYWVAAKCDAFPWPLSLGMFDSAVNHGVAGAWRIMQRALGVTVDGIPGQRTMARLQTTDPENLLWRWLEARTDFYVAIVRNDPQQIAFLRGWLNKRILGLHRAMRDAA